MSVSFCLPHPVAVSAFMICRGLCACTEMLWMCVLYVSFGSKVRPRTFGCVAMGSALLFVSGFKQPIPPTRTIAVALDMIKAFDTVNIHTLKTLCEVNANNREFALPG